MDSIYIIKNNINDKVYIGQTTLNAEERFKQHLKDSSCCNTHLYKAMRKYGKEHFYCELIEDNLSYEQLLLRERYWIQYFDSVNTGYNLTWGGEGHLKYSDDEILDLWSSGLTEREIQKILRCANCTISLRLRAIGISHDGILERMKSQAKRREYDPVLQFDLQGNLKNGILHPKLKKKLVQGVQILKLAVMEN